MSQERRRLPTPAEIDLINAMFEALITGKATRDSGDLVIQAKLSDEHYAALHSFDVYSLMSSGRETPIVADATSGEWVEWSGGYRPVMADTQVEVKLHNGEQYKDLAGEIRWSTRNERDVARYRVVPA